MAEASYRKAGTPLEAARAYADVAQENPAVAEGNLLDWGELHQKKATDISAELNRHEIAGENYSMLAQTIKNYCDPDPPIPAHENG